jgi:hypothetical protein
MTWSWSKRRGTRDGLLRPTKADGLSEMSPYEEACVTVRPE